MSRLTDRDLDQIHARCVAATPGPWRYMREGRDHTSGDRFIMTGTAAVPGRHRAEWGRVGREGPVVAHHEDLAIRDREGIDDLRRLRLRGAVGLRKVHLLPVHEDVPVP